MDDFNISGNLISGMLFVPSYADDLNVSEELINSELIVSYVCG